MGLPFQHVSADNSAGGVSGTGIGDAVSPNDTPNRKAWGDDLPRLTFGPMLRFALGERTSIALIAQLRTMRNFTEETEDYGFYQDHRIDSDDKPRIEFCKAALSVAVNLR